MGTSTVIDATDIYQKHITEKPAVWRGVTQVELTDKYAKSRDTYVKGGWKKVIENKEVEILIKPEDHKLHEAVPHQGKNEFSARLSKNLRIRYRQEGNRLIFEEIAKHDDAYR